jgi:hypothetical protein
MALALTVSGVVQTEAQPAAEGSTVVDVSCMPIQSCVIGKQADTPILARALLLASHSDEPGRVSLSQAATPTSTTRSRAGGIIAGSAMTVVGAYLYRRSSGWYHYVGFPAEFECRPDRPTNTPPNFEVMPCRKLALQLSGSLLILFGGLTLLGSIF